MSHGPRAVAACVRYVADTRMPSLILCSDYLIIAHLLGPYSCFPAESIAENTFRRHPSAGPLWRPFAGLGLRSNIINMTAFVSPNAGPPFLSTQHASSLGHPSGQSGSQLLGLVESTSETQGLPQQQLALHLHARSQGQAEAHIHSHTHAYARTARVVSLSVLSPLAPISSGDTLEPCALQRINSCDDPAAASFPLSSLTMPSATFSTPISRSNSAMNLKCAMAPPSIPSPASSSSASPAMSASLLPSPPACAGASSLLLSPVLSSLPSASSSLHTLLHSSVNVNGLAPPAPHPSAFIPESPIAHARRAPSPARTPPMRLHSTSAQHTLAVCLPEGLAPEMVTVSAKKGARLAVVADLWHREDDCECLLSSYIHPHSHPTRAPGRLDSLGGSGRELWNRIWIWIWIWGTRYVDRLLTCTFSPSCSALRVGGRVLAWRRGHDVRARCLRSRRSAEDQRPPARESRSRLSPAAHLRTLMKADEERTTPRPPPCHVRGSCFRLPPP